MALDGVVSVVTPNVSLQNYSEVQFPERRTPIPVSEQAFSPTAQTISTNKSWNPAGSGITDKVYELIDNLKIQKDTDTRVRTILNLLDGNKYRPMTPTGRDDGYVGGYMSGGGGVDFSGLGTEYMATADGLPYNTARHGTRKSTMGLKIAGIDITKLPEWVKAVSVVRTPPAGRVVCQGIAMYALNLQTSGSHPSLYKYLDRLWFYSPELDSTIGDKSSLFDAIKSNPTDYEIQLVSPVGFFTDVYSANYFSSGPITSRIDMVSYAIMGGDGVHNMEPVGFDSAAQIGIGEDRVTFGRFRNVYPTHPQGAGLINDDLTFSIQSAYEPDLLSSNNESDKSRTSYLELILSSNIYASSHVDDVSGDDSTARAFHEPWYIVNIIQNGKHIPNNNINSYKHIGSYIKLTSPIGLGNGESTQSYELVDEREEDVLTLGASATQYRYIWVDDKPWLGVNNIASGTVDSYRADLGSMGYFIPSGGRTCYGMYLYTYSDLSTGPSRVISFPYLEYPSGDSICPEVGAVIEVRYDPNASIDVFLGDTVVDDAIFAPIDVNVTRNSQGSGVCINAPMPFYNFTFVSNYVRPLYKTMVESSFTNYMQFIRQWVVSFGCESTVNLPFLYKDYFPNRNYVIRPAQYDEKDDSDSIETYYNDHYLWTSGYITDYDDEYLRWGYGGFHIPGGANFDYQKSLHLRAFTRPTSGTQEQLSFMKRLHWSSESLVGYPSSRAFMPTNVYDLMNDKAQQISILYDVLSDKGNNLYVITDYGAGLILTDKKMLTDAGGNALTILTFDSTLVQGELWLNPSIGCPKEFWRGKTEGNVKLPNNIIAPVLIFPSYADIIMLNSNQFLAIADNNRQMIQERLAGVDTAGTVFSTLMHSVIDEYKNDLVFRIGASSFIFNFDQNNWVGSIIHRSPVAGKEVVKTLFIPWIETRDARSTVAQISYNPSDYHKDVAFMVDSPMPVNATPYYPYVIFSITPALGSAVEFIDMFISATHKPYNVLVSMDRNFGSFATIPASQIRDYNTGWYHIDGFPQAGGRKMIGKTMFVRINYPDHANFYGIKLVKTGYREIMGG